MDAYVLKHPFTMMVTGPTSSGKTSWIKQLLESSKINPPPSVVVYFYKRWQPTYSEMQKTVPNIEFVQGMQDRSNDSSISTIYIFDDMMKDATQNDEVCEMYTEGSHHTNLSVICMLQNLYYKGKQNRTMSLNTQYLVLFKNPRDQQQVAVLARQMYPDKTKYFLDKFREATSKPYGYLFIDLKQETPDSLRLKTNIFNQNGGSLKDENTPIISPTVEDAQLSDQIQPQPNETIWNYLIEHIVDKGGEGFAKCQQMREEKVVKNTYLKDMYINLLMSEYRLFITTMKHVNENQIHQQIMTDVNFYEKHGLEFEEALYKAVQMNKNLFCDIINSNSNTV